MVRAIKLWAYKGSLLLKCCCKCTSKHTLEALKCSTFAFTVLAKPIAQVVNIMCAACTTTTMEVHNV
jgi:hypothetical protein